MAPEKESGPNEREGAVRRDVRFPETRWSLVSAVRATDDGARERALAELCRLYWFPVYAFARSRGCRPHQAEDLTQDLFLTFLRKNSFRHPTREKGTLRAYLLRAMHNVMANDARKAGAAKRFPEELAVPIEREDGEMRLAREGTWLQSVTPDQQFDRRWAQALLQEVEARLAREQADAGKREFFETVKPFLAGDDEGLSYAQVASAVGMTEGAVRVAVHRLRNRFKLVLREEVAQTVAEPNDVEDELHHLYAALTSTG